MSVPPPIIGSKKSSLGKTILIIILGIFLLCVTVTVISQVWSRSPEGKIASTQIALTEIAKMSQTAIPTKMPKQSQTPVPQKTSLPTKTSIPTITPTGTPELSEITFQDIKSYRENATEIQWEDYKKQINGKKISWTGTIDDVQKSMNSYYVWVCMDYYCSNRAYFSINDESLAISLNKGQTISFDGYINTSMMDFMDLFGFDTGIDDAIILSK